MAEARKGRMALTVRQLVEDYLAHQLTRPVTRVSTRHHLTPLLAMYGCWQARRVGTRQIGPDAKKDQSCTLMALFYLIFQKIYDDIGGEWCVVCQKGISSHPCGKCMC